MRRWLLIAGIACLIASALTIALFDAGIEHWLEPRVPLRGDLVAWQKIIDLVFLKSISALVGPVVLLGGWLAWRRGWLATRFVMGWGALITAAQYSIDLVKWIAGRERPVQWLPEGDAASPWWQHGNYSFPSGHSGYYWALAIGVALRWPRFSLPALAIAIFVSEQRVLVLAHHGSDVLASIGIVLLWAALLLPWLHERSMSSRP